MVPIVRQPKGCIVFVRPTFNAMSQCLVSGSRRARLTCEQREVKPHVRIGASFATLAWWELVILAIVFSIYHFIVHYGVHWSILSVAQNTAWMQTVVTLVCVCAMLILGPLPYCDWSELRDALLLLTPVTCVDLLLDALTALHHATSALRFKQCMLPSPLGHHFLNEMVLRQHLVAGPTAVEPFSVVFGLLSSHTGKAVYIDFTRFPCLPGLLVKLIA